MKLNQVEYPGFTLGPITLDIPAGFVTGLVGANGAGKTTTLKQLLGIVRGGAVLLAPAVRSQAFGLREHQQGWDGLFPTQFCQELPPPAVIEPPTLDDIVVRITKGRVS